MKISSGTGYKILESGSVMTFKNESLLFEIEDLKIRISFQNNRDSEKQDLSANMIGPKELEFTLTNFNNSLGTGTTEPLSIGLIGNQRLYLNLMVYALGDNTQKLFNYSFYLGREDSNGQ